jgi:hypothetical protein
MIDPLLLTTAQVSTFDGNQPLTTASGFYFERDEKLFLVTSRHVLTDKLSRHFPSRIEINLHLDADNVAKSGCFSILLYQGSRMFWRKGSDVSGLGDVAVLEIDRMALPPNVCVQAFGVQHRMQTCCCDSRRESVLVNAH